MAIAGQKGHRIYMKGVEGLAFRISSSLPAKVRTNMNRALKDCGLIIRDGIVDKVAHHQHPEGVPPQEMGDTQNRHWFPPTRKIHKFSHEYHGDPMVDIPDGVITKGDIRGSDWTLPKPDQHYWPYNRLGELAGSLSMNVQPFPGLGSMTFSVNTDYATELEFLDAGRYSYLTPTIFWKSKKMLEQFKRAMKDVVNFYGEARGSRRGIPTFWSYS